MSQVYMVQNGVTIPCWKVVSNNGHPKSNRITFYNGVNGDVVSVVPTTFEFDVANVFGYQGAQISFGTTPPLTTLLDVVDSSDNGNHGLVGKDFRTSNACFHFKCTTANSSNCNESESICVDPDPSMVENVDYYTLPNFFTTDARFVDYERDWVADGYTDGLIVMEWRTSQVFAPRLGKPLLVNGTRTWGQETNFATYNGLETDDSFAELQVYHWLSLHAAFLRNLLNDTDFCFLGMGLNCTTMDPHTNRTSTPFDHPMRVVVNLQSIQINPVNGLNLFDQINQGRGKSQADPVVFYEATEYPNAYFSNSPFQPPINGSEFRDCSNGSCLGITSSPFNYFAFGQAVSTKDWALNSCIAFHELTHALVQKYIPYLPWYRWAETGVISDPGAINEAWADYFAAIHCGVSDFRTSYSGRPGRTLNNDNTCADIVGEVHQDSLVYSGALWAVRNQALSFGLDPQVYDRLILKSIQMGSDQDTFTTQFNLVLSLLQIDPILNVLVPFAQQEFDTRYLNCSRVTVYPENGDTTFFLSDATMTSQNTSTLATTIQIQPRSSDWGFRLDWTQWADSPYLGLLNSGFGSIPLRYVVDACPIFLSSSLPVYAYRTCSGANETLDWKYTSHDGKSTGSLYMSVNGPSFYFMMVHSLPVTLKLSGTSLTLFGMHMVWRVTICIVSIASSFLFCVACGLSLYKTLKRKFKKSKPESAIQLTDLNGASETPKARGLYNSTYYYLLYSFLTSVFFVASFILALLSLTFKYFRDPLTIGMMIPLIVVVSLDILFGYVLRPRIGIPSIRFHWIKWYTPRRSNSQLDELLVLFSGSLALITAIVTGLFAVPSTPFGVHVVLYLLFVAFFFARTLFVMSMFFTDYSNESFSPSLLNVVIVDQ